MSYLLDTCVLSDFVKGDRGTLNQIKRCSPSELAVSSLTVMEIEFGLMINPQKANKIRPITAQFFEQITIFRFGTDEALCAAEIRAFLRKKGTPIGAYDLLIGASALVNNLTLVTANVKEFERIPELKIENWRNDV
jgi:tRNA(fMet)-specific endonuclease VapC